MKKFLCVILYLSNVSNLFCASYNYGGIGIYAPLFPSIFIGHREKSDDDKRAFDLSARLTTTYPWCYGLHLSAKAGYLGYFGENKNYYWGAGAAIGGGSPVPVYITPSITLGKENTHGFHQIHVGLLIHNVHNWSLSARDGIPPFPVIGYEYGVKF